MGKRCGATLGETRARHVDRSFGVTDAAKRRRTPGNAYGTLALVVALAVAGCAIGPDFNPPATPEGAGYAAGGLPGATVSAPVAEGAAQRFVYGKDIPGEWWRLFRSRRLNGLVEQALIANPSLEAAQASLRQAKETVLATAGALWPQVDGKASATRQQFSLASFGQSGPPLIFNLYQATVNVAYAPDVWGGTRRQIESSKAQAEYQQFQLEATFLTLTANVVTAAIQEASLRGQIEATDDIIKAKSEQLDLMRKQLDIGSVAKTDVLAQESDLVQTQGTLPVLEKQLAQQRHVLMALIGRFPNEDRGEIFRLSALQLPTKLPVSVPSQLVEQRPDVRSAEAQLHQASAQIGVAQANLLPQLSLSGYYGGNSLQPNVLFAPSNIVWNIASGATQPIFHGGTLLAQERAAIEAFEAAAAQYRNTVLLAFQNVADTLRALQDDARMLKIQERALRVASESLELSRTQFKAGSITYLVLLNAQRAYEQARLTLVQAQAARLADTAALFQALGGGWWNRDDVIKDHKRAIPTLVEHLTGAQ
jgi:NodT family efflux transporter outer membrane factor (OMF) lipoprotein